MTINSFELTAVINIIANSIACKLTPSELALVASIFVQIGDTLAAIAAQRAFCEEKAEELTVGDV